MEQSQPSLLPGAVTAPARLSEPLLGPPGFFSLARFPAVSETFTQPSDFFFFYAGSERNCNLYTHTANAGHDSHFLLNRSTHPTTHPQTLTCCCLSSSSM